LSKSFINWSSGKDAMLALHTITSTASCCVDSLVSTVDLKEQHLPLHHTPLHLIKKQANALNRKLILINMPAHVGNHDYKEKLSSTYDMMYRKNYQYAINGDIHLADVRSFKQKIINDAGLEAVFPLWKKPTIKLAHKFINLGYKAMVVCVDLNVLDKSFCGRVFDRSFLNDLPQNLDPCGENGEFHTFCYDGPLFDQAVSFRRLNTETITFPVQTSDDKVQKYHLQHIK
jgi:uncharacterized protein (TIGR00290 family)